MAQVAEVLDEAGDLGGDADRIAGHERAAGHHPVGEEGVAGPREAVAAVGAQREERQAVAAVVGDEAVGAGAVGVGRADRLAVRAQPVVERPERSADHQHREAGVGDPVRVLAAEERERRPHRPRGGHAGKERAHAGRVAGHVEPPAQADERREQRDAADRLLDVEASVGDVRDGGERHERDRKQPCPALAAREPAGEQEQRDAGGERDGARQRHRARGQHRLEEVVAVGERRPHGGDDVDEADDERAERNQRRRLQPPQTCPTHHDHLTGTALERLQDPAAGSSRARAAAAAARTSAAPSSSAAVSSGRARGSPISPSAAAARAR